MDKKMDEMLFDMLDRICSEMSIVVLDKTLYICDEDHSFALPDVFVQQTRDMILGRFQKSMPTKTNLVDEILGGEIHNRIVDWLRIAIEKKIEAGDIKTYVAGENKGLNLIKIQLTRAVTFRESFEQMFKEMREDSKGGPKC